MVFFSGHDPHHRPVPALSHELRDSRRLISISQDSVNIVDEMRAIALSDTLTKTGPANGARGANWHFGVDDTIVQ
jgi:hypothetical protein